MGKESEVCLCVVWQPHHCGDTAGKDGFLPGNGQAAVGLDVSLPKTCGRKDREAGHGGWILGMAMVGEVTGLWE